jgi:alpha-glucosidase (family GH31 glycosyl hydrolase)
MFEKVIKGYKDNGIPLDAIWSDIDYMINFEDFTIDETRFNLAKLNAIAKEYHYVPIIDAGIKVNNGTAYTKGKQKNLFIKDATGEDFHGIVWPGKTVFVDFLHPEAKNYWK